MSWPEVYDCLSRYPVAAANPTAAADARVLAEHFPWLDPPDAAELKPTGCVVLAWEHGPRSVEIELWGNDNVRLACYTTDPSDDSPPAVPRSDALRQMPDLIRWLGQRV